MGKEEKKFRHFFCYKCGQYFKSAEYVQLPDTEIAVGNFIAECPNCKIKVQDVPYYFGNLAKMSRNATGPTTPEGKERTKYNGYKHGKYCKEPMLLAPALHGKYPECKECEYKEDCSSGKKKFCPVLLAPMLRFLEAYKSGEIKEIKEFAGLMQGKTYLTLEMMFKSLFEKGVLYKDKFGNIQRNPILSLIPEYLNSLGFSSDQQMMNPKAEGNKDGEFNGNLSLSVDGDSFLLNLKKTLKGIVYTVPNAVAQRNEDEVLKSLNTDQKDVPVELGPSENPFKNER